MLFHHMGGAPRSAGDGEGGGAVWWFWVGPDFPLFCLVGFAPRYPRGLYIFSVFRLTSSAVLAEKFMDGAKHNITKRTGAGSLCAYEMLIVSSRHGYDSFFIRFKSVSESLDLTQLMTHSGFTRIISNQFTTQNGFLKFESNQRMTQKTSKNILIQINS